MRQGCCGFIYPAYFYGKTLEPIKISDTLILSTIKVPFC